MAPVKPVRPGQTDGHLVNFPVPRSLLWLDCKQSLSGQSRWCAHSAGRLEQGEINEKRLGERRAPKPPSARLLQFFCARLYISRDLSTVQKGTACSLYFGCVKSSLCLRSREFQLTNALWIENMNCRSRILKQGSRTLTTSRI